MSEKKSKFKEFTIPLIAIIGIILTIKLTLIYINANFIIGAPPSFCNINDYVDCDAVAKSQFSFFLGVPNSLWGLLFYTFILFIYYADKIKKISLLRFAEAFKNPQSYIFCLSFISVIVSFYFAWISSHVIHKLCILCYVTYILNILLFTVSKGKNTIFAHFKNSFIDFFSALKNPGYAAMMFILILLGSVILFFVNKTEIFIPYKNNEFRVQMEKFKTNDYKITGNILGDKNANVVLHEYTDFQCPFCTISNSMTHRLVTELSNVEVIHHDFPLDKSCNPIMKNKGHKNSCLIAKYSLAAKMQNKFWDFNSIIFENNQNLDENKVLTLAKQVGIDTVKLKKEAYSPEIDSELKYEVQKGDKLGFKSTPTYRIGMKTYEGLMPYQQLKEILISAGAKPKVDKKK